jgi:hypothetical protein
MEFNKQFLDHERVLQFTQDGPFERSEKELSTGLACLLAHEHVADSFGET